ncbi:hypothetical protein SAMN04487949_0841 [Halogranum gelatinilyticum]|uniref:S-adenosyl-l-methionine hydroxide adenosyltransferase n=1 Tax=Halogranum gelatinilyticum TaxID=660521 RepID=A0A1G9QFY6_9EURY|nr:SAM-dependent chlorinase/fluorinase [Halogranum gelatinilyticum]SDM09886.1 hypothetical protein SAMN04487949_0841 [Halogranum gelatinilyticum]
MLTLASDFGTPYPAAMKGVVLDRLGEDTTLVDVGHDFPRQDVRTAAFWLRETLPYFPPAVHLAVVDPGVGTDRAALAVRVGDHALVGPDNGLLLPPARVLAEQQDADIEVFDVAYDAPESTTFHGRDVFAPVAAEVHEVGVDAMARLDDLTRLDEDDYVDLAFSEPTVERDGGATTVTGEVLVIDDFGNTITNVPGEVLGDADEAVVEGLTAPIVEAFADVSRGDRLLTVGSHGYVECDVNHGRGDKAFGLTLGDEVRFSF